MRDETPEEVAARWLFGAAYAASGLSSRDWWRHLQGSASARLVHEFVAAMRTALAR